jgi:hypothetical protein
MLPEWKQCVWIWAIWKEAFTSAGSEIAKQQKQQKLLKIKKV